MKSIENMEVVISFFNQAKKTGDSSYQDKLASLISFCNSISKEEIQAYLYKLGDKNITELKRTQRKIWECCKFITENAESLAEELVPQDIKRWILPESRNDFASDRLFLLSSIDGECLEDQQWYDYGFEGDYRDDHEEKYVCTDMGKLRRYEEYMKALIANEGEIDNTPCDLSDAELHEFGFTPSFMRNVLKEKYDEVKVSIEKCHLACEVIRTYLTYEDISQRNKGDLDEIAENLAEELNDEIFEQPISGETILSILKKEQVPGLTIKKGRRSLWAYIIKAINDNIHQCSGIEWRVETARIWGLESKVMKLPRECDLGGDTYSVYRKVNELLKNRSIRS